MQYREKISVILPVKNAGIYLSDAIASICCQTFSQFELIIVDDGSTDGSFELARDFALLDPRIRLFRNHGEGLVDALNFGARVARAPYLARMGADDIAMPQRLKRQHDFLLLHPEVDVAGTQVIYIDTDCLPTGRVSRFPLGHAALARSLLSECPILPSTVMTRRSAFDAVGGYRQAAAPAEDVDLWLRVAEIGRLATLSEPLLYCRLTPHKNERLASRARRLALDLAALSAKVRREGGPDPLDGYRCQMSDGDGEHTCQGAGCDPMVCESIKAFRIAEAIRAGKLGDVAPEDVRVLWRHLRRHPAGGGRGAWARLVFSLAASAARNHAVAFTGAPLKKWRSQRII